MTSDGAVFRRPRIQDIIAIALPMVLSQTSETVNLFVDRLFLSKLGKLHIAGAMSGGLTAFNIMSFFIGIIGYVNAVVAQNDGAGIRRNCSRATAQSIRLAFVGWPILMFMIPLVRLFFNAMGHLPEQIILEMSYFRILVFGSIFGLIRHSLAGFFIGLGRTRMVMIANALGMLVNIPANWILIFGKFGMPALGIVGAAYGTLLGSMTIMLILLGIYFSPFYRKEYGTAIELGFDRSLMTILLRYGIPAGLEAFFNITAFNFFVQLLHSYNPNTAAAVTIVFNYDMLAFIPMLGLGFAATTLAGRYVGARDIGGAEHSTRLTLLITWIYAATMMLIFIFGAKLLVGVFTSGLEGGKTDVAPLAVTMLRLAALYTLGDATQLIYAGALRGAGDTKFVMWISVGTHWVFAAIAWFSIKVLHISVIVVWVFFICFVLILGIGMLLRYRLGNWRKMSLVVRS
ncbi:Multidrug and toxin extrusion (MATE) family efflux pump YdhE/NorM, homolog [Olavius algarvensis spirochete endosymbiont]|uniref:MATE family efflux transporter n=1 Tax=Olavius algarvensis spirochete endosymbiont TaxID=260710 RepID=UPI00052DCA03|nr:MATE family efflux transporter [Olavius algarvensis spirochete endosymbiont]KGM44446.1 hypothetical protein JY97_00720 [Alkalispirochaeta odontotermitis]CAD7838393.1 MAG: hypothetical protein [Olavius algarvensis spirochete endosymbiont]VDA99988.1 Multidrug and toxin extrusion (MATE) family efflux pump YdhE/NorM, homolog [Olavius algarvensis spirochete endosymbiont]